MFKKLSILLLCLPLLGFGIIPISGRRDAAPAGGIEDDFSGDLSKWTQLTTSGSDWTISSGELSDGSTSGTIIYTDEQTATISQWVQWEYRGGAYKGAYFRSTNNSSEVAYALRVDLEGDLVWRTCTGHTCGDIQEYDTNVQVGDCVGLEVTGNSAATEVDVWADLGTCPVSRGSWGTADATLTNNPSPAANTGKYVGLYSGWNGATGLFDNFAAGDI